MKAACCVVAACLACSGVQGRAIRATDDPVRDEPPLTAEDRRHWAFQPLAFPVAPARAGDLQAAVAELDALIARQLAKAGLSRSPQADAATLIRRLSFNLTGLPPLPDEVTAFQRAFALQPDAAYEALVDRLLASPACGEHGAQAWLDLARFAETDGFEHDKERPRAWQFRDWIIRALQEDRPFDDFVRQQIAGDLLANGEPEATGFLFAGPDMPDLNNQDERRHVVLNDITGTFGTAFLGLTVGCAACHDHAYDPISQADFYRLRAFFDNTVLPARDRPLGPQVRVFHEGVPASTVFLRGEFRRPGPAVQPGYPRIAGGTDLPAPDRVALAHWLTRTDNVLFLRTAANRLWQQHFQLPLAPVPADLGQQSPPPVHPEVLDWLAAELPRQGWSLKRLHKLLVMSQTWRQATPAPGLAAEAVAQFAAHPRRRLTGEMLRDSLLHLTGRLNPKAGGPGVRLPLPAEIRGTLLKNQANADADEMEQRRRSIYVFARRNARHPIFDLFDRPDALLSCARRDTSTTAPQALLLMNSEFAQDSAAALADLALAAGDDDPRASAAHALQRCLARPARPQEVEEAAVFLANGSNLREALADYCLALINTNEFVHVD
jgi:hypothetical protein